MIKFFQSLLKKIKTKVVPAIITTLPIWFIFLGASMLFIGIKLEGQISEGYDLYRTFSEETGRVILGAGVFAAIMKSALFTEVFLDHIRNVFYSPEHDTRQDRLEHKWLDLTKGLLQGVLPKSFGEHGEQKIKELYLDSDVDFHFEDYRIEFDIKPRNNSNICDVLHTVSGKVLISPNAGDQPFLEQTIRVEKVSSQAQQLALGTVMINDQPIDHVTEYLAPIDGKPNVFSFRLPMKGRMNIFKTFQMNRSILLI